MQKIKEIILPIITNEELKTKLSEIVDKYFEDIKYRYYRIKMKYRKDPTKGNNQNGIYYIPTGKLLVL